ENARALAVGIVEYAGLTRRHPRLGAGQIDMDAAIGMEHARRHRRTGRAHPGIDVEPAFGEVCNLAVADPVDAAQMQTAGGERIARPDDDTAAAGVEMDDIERLARRDADAAALADGVVDDSVVAAEHATVDVDD